MTPDASRGTGVPPVFPQSAPTPQSSDIHDVLERETKVFAQSGAEVPHSKARPEPSEPASPPASEARTAGVPPAPLLPDAAALENSTSPAVHGEPPAALPARLPNIRAPRQNDLAPGETRFVCQVAYDGTAFLGWQSQVGGKTIQDALEKRLAEILGAPVRIHGSGRTDAGVHALAQVFHFDTVWKHSVEVLARALRTGLPAGIQVHHVATARANFHARFSARGKRYRYQIYEGHAPPFLARYHYSIGERRLDLDAMRAAAALLLGVHDFTAFSGRHGNGENPVKDLRRLDVRRHGARVDILTEASGYLYKMVRRLAGGLIQVGTKRLKPAELLAYRDALVSLAVVPAAPAHGLVMEKVFYRLPANAHPVFRRDK